MVAMVDYPSYSISEPSFKNSVETPCSVIIVFRNEEKSLKQLLPRLESQKFLGSVQLVFVDDRSSDQSLKIINEYDFAGKFEVVIEKIASTPKNISPKKNAIQIGIERSKYESLLLMDGDCMPISDEWIQSVKNIFQRNEIYLGLGLYRQEKGFINSLIQFDTFFTALQFVGWAIQGQPYMALGRNWGYKRSSFIEKNGFQGLEKNLGGDDDLLLQKLISNGPIGLSLKEESRTISEPKHNFLDFLRQKIRHLASGFSYGASQKLIAGFSATNHLFLFALVGLLLVGPQYLSMAISLVALRYSILYFGVITGKRRFGINQNLIVLPLTEVLYLISHLSAFFASLFVRNPAWKKEENSQIRH